MIPMLENTYKKLLHLVTDETDNPDLRDRGYVYWRLLAASPETAKDIVLVEKPLISDELNKLEPAFLDELMNHLSTLASVYYKPPEGFVPKIRSAVQQQFEEGKLPKVSVTLRPGPSRGDDHQSTDAGVVGNLVDIDEPAGIFSEQEKEAPEEDYGFFNTPAANAAAVPVSRHVILDDQKGKGLQIAVVWVRKQGKIFGDFLLENHTIQPMGAFGIQFNKNSFGLIPASGFNVPVPLLPQQSAPVQLLIDTSGPISPTTPTLVLQMAVKNNVGVHYFQDNLNMELFFAEDGRLERNEYLAVWKSIPDSNEITFTLPDISFGNMDAHQAKLEARNVFFIVKRQVDNNWLYYFSLKLMPSAILILLELTFKPSHECYFSCRTMNSEYAPLLQQTLNRIIRGL